jgi:hypothetical protein
MTCLRDDEPDRGQVPDLGLRAQRSAMTEEIAASLRIALRHCWLYDTGRATRERFMGEFTVV